ncbi:hypothetical protein [Rhizobium mongolense]|uniref:hypothetical protein n=1 Tax=Rhizobium mongolense TaxID=57676 RepID=UPI0034A2216E
MAYFSISLELAATIYIQATTLPEADAKLQRIRSKPLDANDRRWFSDASFGSYWLPEISFATAMTILMPTPGAWCQNITFNDVRQLMRSLPEGRKSKVIPRSRDTFGEGETPVFEADLRVTTTGIVSSISLEKAQSLIAEMSLQAVHWEYAGHWFTMDGLNDEKFPLILSPNMTIVGVTPGCALELAWPEEDEDDEADEEFEPTVHTIKPNDCAVDKEIDVVADRLRSHLAGLGDGYAALPDDDLCQIAALLIDYRNRREAQGKWPPTTS